jgi:hypothetical protein
MIIVCFLLSPPPPFSLALSLSFPLSLPPPLFLSVCLSLYAQVSGVVADCSKDEDREKLVRDCSAYFDGQLDVLVNNVGILPHSSIYGSMSF